MSKESDDNEVLRNMAEQHRNSIDIKTKELIVTIILSLATLLSAWCGYQSNIWDDTEKVLNGERNLLLQNEVKNTLADYQVRTAHSTLALKIIECWKLKDTSMYKFYMSLGDSVLKNSIEDWIKSDPENNPNAPRNPFQMSSYKLGFEKENEMILKKAEEIHVKAKLANETSDKYLSLTVLLATVLFFTGIGGTLKSRRSQILSLTVSVIIFLISIFMLIGLPIGQS